MAWKTVAEGTSFDDLEATVADFALPKGQRMKIVMDLKFPVGSLFDIAGAEWIAQGFVPEGMDLVDVYGEGSKGIIELESDPAWLIPVLLFIKAHWIALTIAGFALWALVSLIKVSVDIPTLAQMPLWLLVGAAAGIVGLTFIGRKKPT